jgi:hypothetical protein
MKYIKTYEDLDNGPQVGDYVICLATEMYIPEYKQYILDNVGFIVEKEIDRFKLEYRNMPATPWATTKPYWYRWFSKYDLIFYYRFSVDCEAY